MERSQRAVSLLLAKSAVTLGYTSMTSWHILQQLVKEQLDNVTISGYAVFCSKSAPQQPIIIVSLACIVSWATSLSHTANRLRCQILLTNLSILGSELLCESSDRCHEQTYYIVSIIVVLWCVRQTIYSSMIGFNVITPILNPKIWFSCSIPPIKVYFHIT